MTVTASIKASIFQASQQVKIVLPVNRILHTLYKIDEFNFNLINEDRNDHCYNLTSSLMYKWIPIPLTNVTHYKFRMYYSKENLTSWEKADERCKLEGGFLPIIRNYEEAREILAYIKQATDKYLYPSGLFIGLRRELCQKVQK